ncbi:LOW QUALITY PROTEIN: UPF0415 protein C7orf25 homolog [Phymastichus coffea]|uniref:LOW QUALITY PROTEIN: UPF0415 protein C7orf25 homolog n=1 Tax=Phymastichus coffea TaxID=108790 RepID=UPI00273B9B82|nr:LOW QUALITY PROTEIN: UPF0415 protein C7orf25 homolog [Phymastichus coffea]
MVEQLKLVEKVEGVDKLIRKIQQEVKFLNKVRATGKVKKEHLQSTNLIHLNAIVNRLLSANDPVNVLKPFKYQNSRLEIDIVCDGGLSWVKVIARNAKALTLISRGNAEYGQKSVFDQAESYLKCAKNHPHMYRPPDIVFYFACGIEKPLAEKLENSLGIIIEGDIINSDYDDNDIINDDLLRSESETESEESTSNNVYDLLDLNTNVETTDITILNLDVSTLLAYVTNMTNGYANFIYIEPLLTTQAEWERTRPIKPVLDNLFQNKELVVCQTAYDNFTNIINLIGGPIEKKRTEDLLNRVKIVEDIPHGRIMDLNLGGKVKERSRLVFASGENLKSITVSANEGFVRAARMQGVECMVFIHEPRSLSEMKERNAAKIESS